MTPTEKRIYALAQKWARSRYKSSPATGNYAYNAGRTKQRKDCAEALLKLLEEKR